MSRLDRDERAELRAEYASGKWSEEELANIWDLTLEELQHICVNTVEPTTGEPIERLSEAWWAARSPEIRARRCRAHRRNGAQCAKVAMEAQTVCGTHGGRAPQAKAKARRRIDEAADRMAARLLGFAENENVPAYVALQAVESALDRAGLSAKTALEVTVGREPWEEVMGDVMQITRAQHEAMKRGEPLPAPTALPPADLAIVDAEIVEDHTPRTPSSTAGHADAADRGDDPTARPAWATDAPTPPGRGLMTLEEANAELREEERQRRRRRRGL